MDTKKVLFLLSCIFLLMSSSAKADDSVALHVVQAVEQYRHVSGLLRDAGSPPGEATYSAEVLVRDMELRVELDQRELFELLCQNLLRSFLSPLGLMYSRLGVDFKPLEWKNDSAVDLQCIRVLLEAAQKWQMPAYKSTALIMARRLLSHNIYRGTLVDGTGWKERSWKFYSIYGPQKQIELAALDVDLMRTLQTSIAPWEAVALRSLGILAGGCVGSQVQTSYDVDQGQYLHDAADSDGQLLTLYRIVKAGLIPREALTSTREKIVASPFSLESDARASVKTGALAVQLLLETGEQGLARSVLTALERRFSSEYRLGSGLLGEVGRPLSLSGNLLYLTIAHRLEALWSQKEK